MANAVRTYVLIVGAVSVFVVGLMALRLSTVARGWTRFEGDTAVVIRDPGAAENSNLGRAGDSEPLPNIAPYAKVTVSSVDTANRLSSAGVADGVVDQREWFSRGQTGGVWVMLEWDRPALIEEIDLYDRLSTDENVLSGTLLFDDGSMITVGALPPDGRPARITFAPTPVKSVIFRIDTVQGRNAGLAEIMVHGILNP